MLLLHHANKVGHAWRGNSTFGDTVDLVYQLGRAEGDPEEARRFLKCRKARIAAEPPSRWLRLSVEQKSGAAAR